MAALRAPIGGCPWDRAQTFETIAPYTLEEAAEVAEAIARRDLHGLRDELGDLLFQVVFHAQMAEEQDAFDFGDVVEAITSKMIRRHPHVFGDARRDLSPDEIKGLWADIKAQEKAGAHRVHSLLEGVPAGLPALARAAALQAKAGTAGFDWNDARLVLAKIREEADEVEETLLHDDPDARMDEIGDLLFAVTNLARHLGVEPEVAMRRANAKFERRFRKIEESLASEGRNPMDATLEEMESLWQRAKMMERTKQ